MFIRKGIIGQQRVTSGVITSGATTPSEINLIGINTVSDGTTNNPHGYVEYLPANYASGNNFPIWIHYHGGGETGDGSISALQNNILNTQIMNRLNNGLELPFIVLAPMSTSAEFGGGQMEQNMDWNLSKYAGKYDPLQVHISIISGTGAAGLTDWLTNNPPSAQAVNSIAYLSRNGLPVQGSLVYVNLVANNIRTWFHHGTTDGAVSFDSTKIYFDRLFLEFGKIDSDIHRFTGYVGVGHSAWNLVYEESGWNNTQVTGDIEYVGRISGQFYPFASPEKLYDWMLEEVPAKATVTLSVANPSVNQQVDITSDMTYEESFSWDFGDGSAVNTTNKNPSHTYTTKGTKTITLTVTNRFGTDTIVTQELLVISDDLTEVQRTKLDFSSTRPRFDNTWNAINEAAWLADTNPVLTNLSNVSTGWDIRLLANAKAVYDGNFNSGEIAGNANGIYPDDVVISQGLFFTSTNGAVDFQVLGLDPTKIYEFRFFGNGKNFGSTLRPTTWTINGVSATIADTRLNYIEEAVLVNVIPPTNGIVVISVNNNGFSSGIPAYMNAMQIIEREEA